MVAAAPASSDLRDRLLAMAARHMEVEDDGDVDAVMATFSDACGWEDVATGERNETRDAVRYHYVERFDCIRTRSKLRRAICDEARRVVILEPTLTVRQDRAYAGLPKLTDRPVALDLVVRFDFDADGRITRETAWWDELDALVGGGVLPDVRRPAGAAWLAAAWPVRTPAAPPARPAPPAPEPLNPLEGRVLAALAGRPFEPHRLVSDPAAGVAYVEGLRTDGGLRLRAILRFAEEGGALVEHAVSNTRAALVQEGRLPDLASVAGAAWLAAVNPTVPARAAWHLLRGLPPRARAEGGVAPPTFPGKTVYDPKLGTLATLHTTAWEGPGRYVEMAHVYEPGKGASTPHRHRYDMVYTIVRGEGSYVVDGVKKTAKAGDRFVIPAGVIHSDLFNETDDLLVDVLRLEGVAWKHLREQEIALETTYGFSREGRSDARGLPDLRQAVTTFGFTEIAFGDGLPIALQKAAMGGIARVCARFGFRPRYERFSGPASPEDAARLAEPDPWNVAFYVHRFVPEPAEAVRARLFSPEAAPAPLPVALPAVAPPGSVQVVGDAELRVLAWDDEERLVAEATVPKAGAGRRVERLVHTWWARAVTGGTYVSWRVQIDVPDPAAWAVVRATVQPGLERAMGALLDARFPGTTA